MSRRDRNHRDYRHYDRERSRSRDRDEGRGVQRASHFADSRGHRGPQKDEFGRTVIGVGRNGGGSDRRVGEGGTRSSSDTQQFSTSNSSAQSTPAVTEKEKEAPPLKDVPVEDEDEDAELMRMMGFGGFSTSKGTHVADNDKAAAGTARVKKAHQYRQYMNRRGGFNQSLAKVD